MTTAAATPIEALAEQVVAQDIVDGRPDKGPWMDPPPEEGCGCCLWVVLTVAVCIVIVVAVAIVGYATANNGGGTVVATPPTSAVPATAQAPETVTTPANPTYNGSVQMVVQTNNGQQNNGFAVPAQLQLGAGSFALTPAGVPPFNGTVGPGFAVSATGQGGTLTGTLTDGTTQNLTLTTQSLPCPGGSCPAMLLLNTPLSTQPTVSQGVPLGDTISTPVNVTGSPPPLGGGSRELDWPLLAAGVAAGGVGLAIPLVAVSRRGRRDRGRPSRGGMG